ncbi:hypothetical protein C8Q80DRAFT_1123046 [Daedaleopsis nitida]|nr:hypothetical protein C8Q80DRAFT_1123046 [Daedaleopsis nitida]
MPNFPRDNFPISRLALTSAGGNPFFVRDHDDAPWRKLTMAELLPMKEAWEAKHRAEIGERVASKIANAEVPQFEEMLYSTNTVVVSRPKFKVYLDKENVGAALKRQPRVTPAKRNLRRFTGVAKAVPEAQPECVSKGLAQCRPTISKRAPLGTVSNKS